MEAKMTGFITMQIGKGSNARIPEWTMRGRQAIEHATHSPEVLGIIERERRRQEVETTTH
jgi:hypothetical protein